MKHNLDFRWCRFGEVVAGNVSIAFFCSHDERAREERIISFATRFLAGKHNNDEKREKREAPFAL